MHFKENCKKFLKSAGIIGERNQAPLLDMVFGAEGLIEAEDKKELYSRLNAMEGVIRDIERELVPEEAHKRQSFFGYLKERKKTVLRTMIRDR